MIQRKPNPTPATESITQDIAMAAIIHACANVDVSGYRGLLVEYPLLGIIIL